MRVYAWVLIGVSACSGGPETAPDGNTPTLADGNTSIDSTPDPCAGASDGTLCGSQMICIGEACSMTRCGDGFRDVAGGEDCDDGNLAAHDGCEPADCKFSTDCTDSNVCDGIPTCDRTTHLCQPGTPPACADTSDCTSDSCDDALGCRNDLLVDADGDGHAPLSAGSCGDDCDDTRADVFPGAEELCDATDNNCNVLVDEVLPAWYVDCDGDGFAASIVASIAQCTPPITDTGCGVVGAQWVSLRPVDASSTDCDDLSAIHHPRAVEQCDRLDTDCSSGGAIEAAEDVDNDGFAAPTAACSGGSLPRSDCDDTDPAIHP